MEDNEFKQWLSGKAEGFSMEPSEGAFEKVMAGVESGRKSPGRKLWLALLPFIAIGLTAGYFSYQAYRTGNEDNMISDSVADKTPSVFGKHNTAGEGITEVPVQSASMHSTAPVTGFDQSTGSNPSALTGHSGQAGVSSGNQHSTTTTTAGAGISSGTGNNPAPQKGTISVLTYKPAKPALLVSADVKAGEPALGDREVSEADYIKSKKGLKGAHQFSMGFYIEPFASRNLLSLNPDASPEMQAYFEQKRKTEIWQPGVSAALVAEYNPFGGLYISFGLGYARLANREIVNQQFNYIATTTVNYFDTLIYTNPGGVEDTLIVGNAVSSVGLNTDTLNQRFTNTFQYVEIPFSFGYRFDLGRRFGLGLNMGMTTGFLFQTRSLQLDADNQSLLMNQSVQEARSTKVLFNATFGVEFNYRINEHIRVFAGPSLRLGMNSLFDANYPVQHRPISIGLRTGLNYRF